MGTAEEKIHFLNFIPPLIQCNSHFENKSVRILDKERLPFVIKD